MQGSFTSYTYNITALLGRASFPSYSAKKVVVPQFQRGFSWEKSHISTFWDDVITFYEQLDKREAQENYFFGPIVVLHEDQKVNLLDGQQRLATITILLAAIRDIARTLGQKGSDLARDIHRDLIMVDDDEDIYALTLSELDAPYFRDHIQADPPDSSAKAMLRSHRLIRQGKSYLLGKVGEFIDGLDNTSKLSKLKALKNAIGSQLKFVAIEVKSEEEAFLIFETLNDRGLRLAVPDLVLNHLMRTAENSNARNQVRNYWNTVVENLGQRKVSTFVRHMWVSRYGDVKTQGLYREIRNNLDEQGITSLDFATLCAKESEEYVAITNFDKERLGDIAYEPVEKLMKFLSADRALPLLLSGLVCLDLNDFAKLARATLNVVVRHSIFANLNPSDLEDALYSAARILRDESEKGSASGTCLLVAKDVLAKINPTRDQITTGITEVFLTKKQANYIIYAIGQNMQTKSKNLDLSANTLEHIFPENDVERTDWPNAEELEPFIWHIGNLTPLEPSLNRRAGNKSFQQKKMIYSDSDLQMTQKVGAKYQGWNVNQIITQAKSLLPTIRDIWKETL